MYPLHRFQRSAIIFNQGVLDDVIISSAGWLGWKAALVYCYLRHHSYSNNVVTLTAEGCRLRYIFIQADHNEDGKLSKIEACPFLQKKTSAQRLKATSVVVAMRHWGWSLALASLKLGVETQEFFNFAAGASRLTNTNEPLRTSQSAILTCTWQHALSDIAGTLP